MGWGELKRMSMRLRVRDTAPDITEYDLAYDGELSVDDTQQIACEISDDMIDKREAGLRYCRINDSDAQYDLKFEEDEAMRDAFEKLKHGNVVKINFYGDEELEDDEELEESSKKKNDYHRFLENYLDSLERRQERLR
jgi:hypothetical protein